MLVPAAGRVLRVELCLVHVSAQRQPGPDVLFDSLEELLVFAFGDRQVRDDDLVGAFVLGMLGPLRDDRLR